MLSGATTIRLGLLFLLYIFTVQKKSRKSFGLCRSCHQLTQVIFFNRLPFVSNPLAVFVNVRRYEEVKYDVITFNFGLHDMEYNTSDGSHSIANYTAQLESIADKLLATK
jgi:hypothetical protein